MANIIDVNILVTANGKGEISTSKEQLKCVRFLEKAQQELLLLDDEYEIYKEYQKYNSYKGQPGLGDAFFKYVHENQAVINRIKKVGCGSFSDEGYDIVPTELKGFDRSDHKYLACGIAVGCKVGIFNATDSDWADWKVRIEQKFRKIKITNLLR